ncbi:UDP-N-acetylmuramoylalanine--D-glutamate ligase [[Clostridium] ultunense Esp]|nr:UDP-N-acetylmuramoylalanine--D-glutamate ligase [[Clostridium] ultunense Esp]
MANWMQGEARYRGKRVLILGAAKSGVGVARLLLRLGASVLINDRGEPEEGERWKKELARMGAVILTGGHPSDLLQRNSFDLVVKNPGIPYSHPYVQEAEERGIPVVTEVEVGCSILEGEAIAITGSNGKTTTTTLTGRLLARKNPETIVAGNIGNVMSEEVVRSTPSSWTVMELSSFQLKGVDRFHPQVAVLLNLYPHHLDYHGSMEDYIASKMKMFQNQTEDDLALFNRDQELVVTLSKQVRGQVAFFSRKGEVERGSYIAYDERGEKNIFYKGGRDLPPRRILPVREIKLLGDHNLENILAAVAVASHYGVDPEAIRDEVRGFTGVEHRLEFVREVNGVSYYNDSKATNPEAAEKALRVFTKPVILIAGGLERGESFAPLIPYFRQGVKGAVLYGETKERLKETAREAGLEAVFFAQDVEEATLKASSLADRGDVVLLSPACASWDLYPSYEVRGRIFKETVHRL